MGLNRLAYVLGLIFLASCTQKSFQDTIMNQGNRRGTIGRLAIHAGLE